MSKRFAVIGSGWRAEFYIRIALHPGNDFELTGLLCRGEEKQHALAEKYGIQAVLTEEAIIAGHPDFIVVAVSKASIAAVSAHWQELGFTVLCETPAALTLEELTAIDSRRKNGAAPLVVAEQYPFYDTYRRLLEVVDSGKLGEPVAASVSLAHDYHGARLLRLCLGEAPSAACRVRASRYELPVTRTADRYHTYTDGEIVQRTRTTAQIEFEDGRIGLYDFDSEQYRSAIRHNRIHITGTRGELMNEKLWYLDEHGLPHEVCWTESIQDVRAKAHPGELTQDERAILALMEKTHQLAQAAAGKTAYTQELHTFAEEELTAALADAAFMLLLQHNSGEWTDMQPMPWLKKMNENG